ncbi:hypothetical protein D6789_02165 [Candidatus Woesearchaeota archaeon]|nr:MAG: hypothetical protein D6789_02165 [Candidatus Woesearchaeota archaeon]
MALTHFSPVWFRGYDLVLEVSFVIITFLVAFFAVQSYRRTLHKQLLFFSVGFLFVSAAYIVEVLINTFILLGATCPVGCTLEMVEELLSTQYYGLLLYGALMLLGLTILLQTALRYDSRLFVLIVALTVPAFLLSKNPFTLFNIFASVMLAMLSWHFMKNYWGCRNRNALLVGVAFVLLLFGNVHFLFSIKSYLLYVLAHILTFVAYLLILANLYFVTRR